MKKRSDTKGRIVDAAWKLFYDQGYENTTVEEIIAASGTSKGSFYHYFSGKDALLSSLGEEAEAYLRTTCGAEPETMTADELNVFKLAVKRMVLAAYDDPAGAQDPPGVRRLINGVKQFTV